MIQTPKLHANTITSNTTKSRHKDKEFCPITIQLLRIYSNVSRYCHPKKAISAFSSVV